MLGMSAICPEASPEKEYSASVSPRPPTRWPHAIFTVPNLQHPVLIEENGDSGLASFLASSRWYKRVCHQRCTQPACLLAVYLPICANRLDFRVSALAITGPNIGSRRLSPASPNIGCILR